MKTVGIIGGMSWESTAEYYRIINEKIRDELGGLHSAQILLYSVDFAQIEQWQTKGEWDKSAEYMSDIAQKLQAAGADFIIIATNTMHKLAPQIEQKISVPLLHIADATADVLVGEGMQKIALLGTRYTMTQDFYKAKLKARGLEVVIPCDEDVKIVNDIIFEQLCMGVVLEDSRKEYQRIIVEMKERGAQAVVFGCTEIGLLLSAQHSALPVFDTAVIHAEKTALELMK